MNLVLSVMENLRTAFKYTYLTNKEFAKNIDFPYTEENDNDGKTYFMYDLDDEKSFLPLTLSNAKELSTYVKPTLYVPKTTAYIEHDMVHVVVNHRHIVLSPDFTLRFILPRDETSYPKTILYEKYKLSRDTTHVAFYEDYCIPLMEEEACLLSQLMDLPIKSLHHIYRV